jgi:hypothetical protein
MKMKSNSIRIIMALLCLVFIFADTSATQAAQKNEPFTFTKVDLGLRSLGAGKDRNPASTGRAPVLGWTGVVRSAI